MDGASDRDLKLWLGCSIFLSHSGADKDFVRFLNEALTHIGYRVFYDEQSLPKAKSVSMSNILAELKDVKLAVLVLSDAFFKWTPHPMSELTTIVAAPNIQMLPVFYGFSVDEFKTKCGKQKWLRTWKTWVHKNVITEDIIQKWEDALKAVSCTNGVEYCKEATNTLELRNKIVARVCQIVKPDLRWSAEGVQGMDRFCQVVSEKFANRLQQSCTNSVVDMENESVSKQTMVGGMYGIAGTGKSTLCRALCDFFFKEFNGRVCYIDLGDHTEGAVRKRLEFVITWLSTGGTAPPQHWSDDQLWNMLKDHNRRFGSPPVFLAINNVQAGSMDEAEKYLGCGPFPTGSKIFLTAQSVDVLKALLVGHNEFCSWIQRITHLTFHEARKIFLCKIYSQEHTALSHQQGRVVDDCVNMCTLNKSHSDYYPMLLIVLASYMRQTSQDPLQWQGKLEDLRRDGIFASESKHIAKLERIFKRIYDSLAKDQQHMLLDLALYLPDALNRRCNVEDVKKYWLDHIYPYQNVNLILSQIAYLSLVEGEGMSVIHAGKCFHVHDLLREFVKKEGTQSCTRVFKEHQIVKPEWRPWEKRRLIKRVGLLRCHFEDPTLDLSRMKKLRVLHLIQNDGLKRVQLRNTAWSSLQSLIVQTSTPVKISVLKAHRAKKNQAFYVDVQNCNITSEASDFHKNPNSGLMTWRNVVSLQLQNVRMYDGQIGVCLGGFRQLHMLELADLPDLRMNLEFDQCPNIREIILRNLPNLEAISGLENSLNLADFCIESCSSVHSLVVLDKCASYKVKSCKALESIEVVCQSQLRNEGSWSEGSLFASQCPLIHIIGLSQRKFIRKVEYALGDFPREWPLMQRLECSPEIVKQMFEFSEYRSEQHMRTATIDFFSLKPEGLSQLIIRDVQDTSSYILAVACTSASSLENLQVWCSREEGACGCHCLLRQPRFDCLKMALKVLTFECTSVWDLSSLENCSLMKNLELYGCLSAVKWPDFGKMIYLKQLRVFGPGSLSYWPSGLQNHPSLGDLSIIGSNQIPPEELLEVLVQSNQISRPDWFCSYAALQVLVDDVYSSRKDNLHIAKTLMANNEKLLSMIHELLFGVWFTKRRFFHLLSQLLYGLWVEADCTLHECTPACAGIKGTQMQLVQDCLQGLLSSKTMISALLLTIPQNDHLWHEPADLCGDYVETWSACSDFRTGYAYESLVLVCCASIQKFGVPLEEVKGVGDMVDAFFGRWEENQNYSRLPLLLWDRVLEENRMSSHDMWPMRPEKGRISREMLIEHDLSAVRVADAVCRLKQVLCEGNMDAHTVMLDQAVKNMYGTYYARANKLDSQSNEMWRKKGRIEHDHVDALKQQYLECDSALTLSLRSRVFEACEDACTVILDQVAKEMYVTDHSRALLAKKLDSHSTRKQWHHPVGCSCALRRWDTDFRFDSNKDWDFSALGMDSINVLRRYG